MTRRRDLARTRAVLVVATLATLAACTPGPGAGPRSGPGPTSPSRSTETTSATDLPGWELVGGLRVPRDDFGTAVVGDEVWVLGGMTGDRGTRLDSIEVLDTRTGTWRLDAAVMPEGLASFEVAAVGSDIYAFGGLDVDTRASDFAGVLDTRTGRWRRLPPLPTPRYAHTVTLHHGRIYVIGGEGVAGTIGQVDVFDPRTERWSVGAPMPRPRGSHDTVSVGKSLYVIGGWLDGGPSDLVQTYDPGTGRWGDAAPVPGGVSRGGAAHVEGRLWVSFHAESYVMDPAEGSWSDAPPLTVSRHGLGYVAVGSRIYGIAGCLESPLRDVRTVDVLDLSDVSLE